MPEPYLSSKLSWHITHLDACIDRFTLKFTWFQQEETATLACAYDSQIFLPADIEVLIERYLHLLDEALQNPTVGIDALPIISQAERQRLIVDFNQTYREYARDKCIHQLFEEQVLRTSEAIAVRWGEEALTYRELDTRAQALAQHLQTLGVGPEIRVGIFMERSPSLLVAILGVMKAGGVYVPLDPTYPVERLAFIAAHATISLCLTQDELLAKLPEIPSCHILSQAVWPQSVHSPSTLKSVELLPENLAYVLYTSGSTGRPKGVMVTQQGLTNYLFWSLRNYCNTGGSGAPVHSSISFDLTVTSLFAPLLAGQCVEMVPEGRGVEEMIETLRRRDTFSLIKLTPAHLDLLSQSLSLAEAAHATKLLIIGGEQLYYEQLAFWRTHAPHIRLINEYGPTETVVGCAVYEVSADTAASGNVPIGHPIDNVQLYVLDRYLNPVPENVPGQLYIGGDGLARGYFNAPDLSAERFLPNPFSPEPGARFYCTGDCARLLADGNLEFLGRMDYQVKVRGFRIELPEIEMTLLTHPAVHEAAVVVREEQPGDQRLVAYIVPSAHLSVTADELQQFLHNKLPEYMIPSSWMLLPTLPLNVHGKVDRQALPVPSTPPDQREKERSSGPRSFIEEVLMDIWRQVLRIEGIRLHDNFFSLGGHSILAVQVIARIRDALHVDVPMRLQFEAPTIADMAERVEALRLRQQDLQIPPLQHVVNRNAVPLTYVQERLWYVYLLDPDSPRFNNFLIFHIQGILNEDALRRSLQAIIDRHDALRTSFTVIDGKPMQIATFHVEMKLECRDLRHLPQEERDTALQQMLRKERQRPIDLQEGPLLRAVLVYIDEQEYRLALMIHHIVYDGWSRGILYRELAELYAAYTSGRQPSLPELSIHYLDFAAWQRQWLQDKILKTQLAYWRKQLEGAPSLLTLPWDRPRPAVQTFQSVKQHFILPQHLSKALKEFSHREGVTLFMVLMAGFKALLYRYSGQEDLVIAFPVANRDRTELEGVFGLFSDVLLLRTRFSGKTSFRELLTLVHKELIEAYANHDVPFTQVFEALSVKRHTSYNPVFQVLFECLLMPEHELELQDLSVRRIDLENLMLDLDLYLSISEEPDGSLHGQLAYNSDLFEPATIDRILRHFEILLGSIVENPHTEIAQLQIMAPEERKQLTTASSRRRILAQIKNQLSL